MTSSEEPSAIAVTRASRTILGRTGSLVLLAFAGLLGGAVSSAEEPAGKPDPENSWKVGFARVDVTPERPVFLAGYASRNRPFSKVAGRLFAKAMVLEDRDGHQAALVTVDVIGLQAGVARPILAELAVDPGLGAGQVSINASHTHTGPVISLGGDPMYRMPVGDMARTVAYTRELQAKLVQVVRAAAAKLEPATLSVGTGMASIGVNRREFTAGGVILGVNPAGLHDRSVPVLKVTGADGKPRGIVFGTAVHGTTLGPEDLELNGDFAAFAQEDLEAALPGVQAMYALGFAGDANPHPRTGLELAKRHGKTVADEVRRVLNTRLRPLAPTLRVAGEEVELPLIKPPTLSEAKSRLGQAKGMDRWVLEQSILRLERGERLASSFKSPFAVWQLGEELTWVFFPGEVVVEYDRLLRDRLGPRDWWFSAYTNDVFGYLPSKREVAEGGYETRGIYYGGIGQFEPSVERVVIDRIDDLCRRVGRPVPATNGGR